jgi:hypothetical protein
VRAFVDLDRPFEDTEGQPTRATDVSHVFGFVPAIDDAFLRSLLKKDEAAVDAAFRGVGVIAPPEMISGIARSEIYVHNADIVSLHSNDAPIGSAGDAPSGWEVGRYGVSPADSHAVGKPSSGVHLSVEGGTLNGQDSFSPGNKWVSGAQAFALGDLNPNATATFDVLLSVNTVQTVFDTPAAAPASPAAPGPPMLLGLPRGR